MESSVTRLLVATKQLLEALNLWAQGRMSETGVSDVYVKLGNDFNAAVAAFGSVRIDMADLINIPDQLRRHLESALSETASTAVLDQYLPEIRTIIINLLQGLKDKQAQWRRHLAEEKRRHENSRLSRASHASSRDSVLSELAARRQVQMTSPRPAPRGDEFSPSSSTTSSSRNLVSPPPQQGAQQAQLQPPPEVLRPPPPPPTIQFPEPEVASSSAKQSPQLNNPLAELKRQDPLERRASKRFSSYTMGKMTSSASVSGGISTLGAPLPNGTPSTERRTSRRISSIRANGTPFIPDNAPPLPPIPDAAKLRRESDSQSSLVESTYQPERVSEKDEEEEEGSVYESPFNIYLTIGHQTKKTKIEDKSLLTLAGIRMMFIDRFAYSSGLEDFPLIYLRDPSANVDYELEDVMDVKEGSVLSLNIEPLDQVKQHFDLSINSVSQELKELKNVLSANTRRFSSLAQPPQTSAGNAIGMGMPSAPASQRPTEKQFKAAAEALQGQSAKPSQQLRIETPSTDVMKKIRDLQAQFDNVQAVRRDLGITKQIYIDFMNETKDQINELRTSTNKVRELANTEIGGARAYIDVGKSSLDGRSQEVLTRMEEIQDTVDELKHDVIARRTKPRPNVLKNLKNDFEKIKEELEALEQQVETVKPMWKKTWAEELQNIVDEQGFLNHQEKLLADLKDDHAASLTVFQQVEQVASIRSAQPTRRVVPEIETSSDPTQSLDTVLLEIRNRQNDPEKRLKAIEAAEKQRERDAEAAKKGGHDAEFANELVDFVDKKSLKKTGGFNEIERVRRKKDDVAFQNMFKTEDSDNDEFIYQQQETQNESRDAEEEKEYKDEEDRVDTPEAQQTPEVFQDAPDDASIIDNESSLIAYTKDEGEKQRMTDVVSFKKPSKKGRPAALRQKSPPKDNSRESHEKSSVATVKDRRSAVKGVGKKRQRETSKGEDSDNDQSGGGVVDVAWSATNSNDNTMNRNTAVVDLDAETIDGPNLKKYKEGDEVDAQDLEDDGMYKGLNSYTSHLKKKPDSSMSDKFKAGPVRAPTNIRQITITDFQPDVCKDYKETGWCGYGDTCKFLHDRSDYMAGWQLDQAWNKMQAQKSGAAAFEDDSDDSEDEDLPFACLITREPFVDPVVTKCGHYFEKKAALKRYQKTPKCYACGTPTGGIFNKPKHLIKKLQERAAKEEAEAQEADSDDNGIEGLEERNETSEE
ncbi:AIP3-domain-containing protein [Wallemia mellicola]|nr:AIP3-domain-containing protein [Wallemia mellicola]